MSSECKRLATNNPGARWPGDFKNWRILETRLRALQLQPYIPAAMARYRTQTASKRDGFFEISRADPSTACEIEAIGRKMGPQQRSSVWKSKSATTDTANGWT